MSLEKKSSDDKLIFPTNIGWLKWKLINDHKGLTEVDLSALVQVVTAYEHLINTTQKRRNSICKWLKK